MRGEATYFQRVGKETQNSLFRVITPKKFLLPTICMPKLQWDLFVQTLLLDPLRLACNLVKIRTGGGLRERCLGCLFSARIWSGSLLALQIHYRQFRIEPLSPLLGAKTIYRAIRLMVHPDNGSIYPLVQILPDPFHSATKYKFVG